MDIEIERELHGLVDEVVKQGKRLVNPLCRSVLG